MRTDARRRRLIEKREAGKVGRRYYAFYRGYQARRTSRPGNPYKIGTNDHAAWDAGWKYEEMEESDHEPSSP